MLRIFTWPFVAAGAVIAFLLSALGRLFSFGLGFAVAALGVVLCMTVVGLIVGVPMVLFGGGLMLRALF